MLDHRTDHNLDSCDIGRKVQYLALEKPTTAHQNAARQRPSTPTGSPTTPYSSEFEHKLATLITKLKNKLENNIPLNLKSEIINKKVLNNFKLILQNIYRRTKPLKRALYELTTNPKIIIQIIKNSNIVNQDAQFLIATFISGLNPFYNHACKEGYGST
jgi:hypothetical protein